MSGNEERAPDVERVFDRRVTRATAARLPGRAPERRLIDPARWMKKSRSSRSSGRITTLGLGSRRDERLEDHYATTTASPGSA
jgi:hypothetical protein